MAEGLRQAGLGKRALAGQQKRAAQFPEPLPTLTMKPTANRKATHTLPQELLCRTSYHYGTRRRAFYGWRFRPRGPLGGLENLLDTASHGARVRSM